MSVNGVAALFATAGPVIPNYGSQSSSCVVHNHLFCSDWISHNWGPVLWPALREHVILAAVAVSIGFVDLDGARARSTPLPAPGAAPRSS